ncbi:carbohydrate esterase family 12 protein [Plenodomus tracheiphilus IPT5]|uniref:Carbohydrate esterase family 12 protein n=1 Tax=Plenodomus tracheiphilus IPT5 TaxID=1408161 RepID=A0A6A7BAK3_9PLEO|nr:carbohydrate esterase family 12 protein [Plenodomus tracheiphilus IPT5]
MLSSTSIFSLLAFTATTLGAPADVSKRAQTVYLAGDSTMARGNGIIDGWGVYFPYSVTLPVVNKAIGGRSSRSYTVEGRFDEIINAVKANDIVIIEFGHNDGGSLSSSDNGRSVCPGTGSETCQSTYNGQQVTVHTFPYYLTEAGKKLIAKGAKVIIASQTPNNPWESGSFVYTDGGRFVTYAEDVAKALGSNAMYVDHGAYTANIWKSYGKAKTDTFFPQDHTHTSPAGAAVVAKAFVKGLQCGGGGFLDGFVKNSTASIEGTCL